METLGTVTVTKHSSTVTGAGTAFDADDHEGKYFRVFENNVWYLIKEVVSATEITLDRAYRGETASGQYYELGNDQQFSDIEIIEQEEAGAGKFNLPFD